MPVIEKRCPWCRGQLEIKTNRMTGHKFLGCANYPECTYTEKISESVAMRLAGAQTLPGME